jgi:pyrroloquinoline-quinone synthase
MADRTRTVVLRTLNGKWLLDHPFYRRWERGELSRDELTAYAEQYRHFEAAFPALLVAAADRVPEGKARDSLLENLADEIGEPTHVTLFEAFAGHYGARDVTPSPAMAKLLATYRWVVTQSAATTVSGIVAYELQGADIARTKAAGLTDFYGADDGARQFWDVHAGVEDHHAQWTLDALDELEPTEEEIVSGVFAVADAWWSFLDERELLAVR